MEGLIELVAASFVRHGIECPADSSASRPSSAPGKPAAPPIEPAALPEHSFRKKLDDIAV
ncbi:MAG TPA: hypothetical protein VMI10_26000 [Terriglobales bacterium]|nr:hypothetical protein [Terriglobales bacterium]